MKLLRVLILEWQARRVHGQVDNANAYAEMLREQADFLGATRALETAAWLKCKALVLRKRALDLRMGR